MSEQIKILGTLDDDQRNEAVKLAKTLPSSGRLLLAGSLLVLAATLALLLRADLSGGWAALFVPVMVIVGGMTARRHGRLEVAPRVKATLSEDRLKIDEPANLRSLGWDDLIGARISDHLVALHAPGDTWLAIPRSFIQEAPTDWSTLQRAARLNITRRQVRRSVLLLGLWLAVFGVAIAAWGFLTGTYG